MNIVLTVYLTQRVDPQRNIFWQTDQDDTVRPWIDSARRCGLSGIIFYDRLSREFIERWTSESVHFVQADWLTDWTAAEERVQIYNNWLGVKRYDWVCTTDLADVEFYRDPFTIMREPGRLYVGSETETIGDVVIIQNWMKAAYGEVSYRNRQILNPGIVGGQYELMASFLGRWLAEMHQAIQPTPPPHDIAAFNRLIYRENIPFVTGYPLHTVFRKNQPRECGAAIRHK